MSSIHPRFQSVTISNLNSFYMRNSYRLYNIRGNCLRLMCDFGRFECRIQVDTASLCCYSPSSSPSICISVFVHLLGNTDGVKGSVMNKGLFPLTSLLLRWLFYLENGFLCYCERVIPVDIPLERHKDYIKANCLHFSYDNDECKS